MISLEVFLNLSEKRAFLTYAKTAMAKIYIIMIRNMFQPSLVPLPSPIFLAF